MTNKTISAKLFSLNGSVKNLFVAIGFKEDGENMVFEGNYLRKLNRGIKLAEEALDPVKCKFMTPEELTKHNLIKAQAKAYAAKQAADKERVAEAERMRKYDAVEKAGEEIVDSVGNELKFGANIHKFEAPRRG